LPSGEQVVVKIQYPGVADAIQADLANFGMLYAMTSLMFPNLEPGPVVEELRERVSEELDYSHEAKNQRAFHDLYRDHPFIRVPRVIDSHSTTRVLTSEFVAGRRWQDALTAPDADRQRYAEVLYRFVFGSITRFGVFNGDPHPGNYLFDDAGKVVFLDYGCVKFFPIQMRREWRALQSSHMAGDKAQFHAQAVKLGFLKADTDVTPELIYDYFNYFYEPFREDRVFTFTSEYNAKSFAQVFRPQGPFLGLQRKLNMPPDFVFVNRIQWGVVSLLSQLQAQANWHQIHNELLFDAPPSTTLGHVDHEYRAKWRREHDLEGATELALTQDGIRKVA
jgi:predicted unusual protein kinase regulating ubiquinone biosynthesis (AarF/ABC1/UbiB family)